MINFLYPNGYEKSIYDIDYGKLRKNGKTCLIFDLDNTVAPYDVPLPDSKAVSFFHALREMGFGLCLVSNNGAGRVDTFNGPLGLLAIPNAGKPGKGCVARALGLLKAAPGQAVFIGDQVFTDVWCGNRCGLHTILVGPASERDEFSVRLKRLPERLVLWAYKRGRLRG